MIDAVSQHLNQSDWQRRQLKSGFVRVMETRKVMEFYQFLFKDWKVVEFYQFLFKDWKVMEFYHGQFLFKAWKVMEFYQFDTFLQSIEHFYRVMRQFE